MQKQETRDSTQKTSAFTKTTHSSGVYSEFNSQSIQEENFIEEGEKTLLTSHFKNFRIIFLTDTRPIQIQVLKEEARFRNVSWLVEQVNLRMRISEGAKLSKSSDSIQMLRTESRRIVYDYLLSVPSSTLDSFPDNIDFTPYIPVQRSINLSDPISMSPGVKIGDFDMYAKIGRGGFSTVYVGRKRDTGKIYAIKQVKKGYCKNPQYESNALINEKNIHLKLEGILHITLHYAFQSKYHYYLVLDYLPGGNLRRLLREKTQFTEAQTRFFIAETLSDLILMHDKYILYRDLKSENLLLDAKGHVHICDFGITKQLQPENPYLTSICGTLEMMAPEVVMGEKYSFTADYYGLGVLTYELLIGNPPFSGEQSKKELVNKIVNVHPTIPNNISPNLEDFLRGLLTKDPSKRLGAKGYKEILEHPWLAGIDFGKVKARSWPACFDMAERLADLKFKRVYQINNESENEIVEPVGPSGEYSFAYGGDNKSQPMIKARYFSALKENKPNFSRFNSIAGQMNKIPFISEMMGQSFDTATNIVTNVLFSESASMNSRNSEHGQFKAFHTLKYLIAPSKKDEIEDDYDESGIPVDFNPVTKQVKQYRMLTKANMKSVQ